MLAFSALSDPTRFHIVEMLAKSGRLPASKISAKFAVSPSAISQHLKILRNANLVSVEIKAQQRIYALNSTGITDIEDWVLNMRRLWMQRFDALDEVLKEEIKKSIIPKGDKNGRSRQKRKT